MYWYHWYPELDMLGVKRYIGIPYKSAAACMNLDLCIPNFQFPDTIQVVKESIVPVVTDHAPVAETDVWGYSWTPQFHFGLEDDVAMFGSGSKTGNKKAVAVSWNRLYSGTSL